MRLLVFQGKTGNGLLSPAPLSEYQPWRFLCKLGDTKENRLAESLYFKHERIGSDSKLLQPLTGWSNSEFRIIQYFFDCDGICHWYYVKKWTDLHKRQKRFFKIICTPAKFGYFRPVFTDGRYKLLKYTDAFLLAGYPNVVIIFSTCNDMFPRRFNRLNSIGLIIRSNDPGFSTITWNNNTGIICFFELCGKESFEVRHIPCHRSIMSRARKDNRTGSPSS